MASIASAQLPGSMPSTSRPLLCSLTTRAIPGRSEPSIASPALM